MSQKMIRFLWIALGFLSLAIGAIGAILPLLPTFPFLMLTLFCFAKSSEKLHAWFQNTKLYKQHLKSYVNSRTMKKRTKVTVMLSLTLFMGIGFLMMNKVPVARMILLLVWLFHAIYFTFGVKTQKSNVY